MLRYGLKRFKCLLLLLTGRLGLNWGKLFKHFLCISPLYLPLYLLYISSVSPLCVRGLSDEINPFWILVKCMCIYYGTFMFELWSCCRREERALCMSYVPFPHIYGSNYIFCSSYYCAFLLSTPSRFHHLLPHRLYWFTNHIIII